MESCRRSRIRRFVYQGFNNQPSFDGVPVGFTPSGVAVEVQIYYPKMTMAGLSFAIPTRLLTVKGEAAQFNSSDSRADEYALYVMQLERQAGEWFFVGGYAGEAITKRGTRAATFAPDRGLSQTFLGRAGIRSIPTAVWPSKPRSGRTETAPG